MKLIGLENSILSVRKGIFFSYILADQCDVVGFEWNMVGGSFEPWNKFYRFECLFCVHTTLHWHSDAKRMYFVKHFWDSQGSKIHWILLIHKFNLVEYQLHIQQFNEYTFLWNVFELQLHCRYRKKRKEISTTKRHPFEGIHFYVLLHNDYWPVKCINSSTAANQKIIHQNH